MTIRALKSEVSRLRQEVAKSMPPPGRDLFAEIERTAQVFALLRRGDPVPPELADPDEVVKLAELNRRFDFLRAGETDQEGR